MSAPRPTPSSIKRRSTVAAAAALAVLGLAVPLALAKTSTKTTEPALTTSLCEGQLFSQPYLAIGDSRFYTPLPGGEFNSPSEGWTLSGGAGILTTVKPDGSKGGVLDLPTGAKAVSPPICVTLAYPIARAWVNNVGKGSNAISVYVGYAGTISALTPEMSGSIHAKHSAWTLAEFGVEPKLAGKEEAPRYVTFTFEGKLGRTQLSDVYVDPRMSR